MIRASLLILALCLSIGCGTVTLRDVGVRKIRSNPTYQEVKSFYLWGLVGDYHIDGKAQCNGKTPVQMQAQTTLPNALLTFVTLGIYAPRTAKVWCSEDV